MRKHGARAQPDAIYVYVLYVLKVFEGQFVDRTAYVNARIAYQHVDAAELFESMGDHPFNFFFFRDVCTETDGLYLVIRGYLASARVDFFWISTD